MIENTARFVSLWHKSNLNAYCIVWLGRPTDKIELCVPAGVRSGCAAPAPARHAIALRLGSEIGQLGMNYKELGKTGILLPELALGTWQYNGGVEPIVAGMGQGVTFIDTAESYGSERVVGQAISGRRHDVFVATKALPRHFRKPDLVRAAEESLRRLNTDYIDLYQLHWPNYAVPIGETMAAMEELVAAGKIRFIGVSNFSIKDLQRAQRALSKNKIVSNQVRYSIVDRTIEDGLLQYCESKQITILAFSPLAASLETIRSYDREDLLGRIAAATGKTRAQVALNWCIGHPCVIAIFKADKVEHVRENCGASGWSLGPSDCEALERIPFRRRGRIERFARRIARRCLQTVGRNV